MRFRTFAGVALTMFAVPAAHALAADPLQPVTRSLPVVLPLPAPSAVPPPPLSVPAWTAPPAAGVPQLVAVPPTPLTMPAPTPCALPTAAPVPVCCADGGLPRSSLDYLRKLAAAHAETGARASYMVKLRYVAAADTASAIQKHLGGKAGTCTVGADPASNTLIACGEPGDVRRALDLAAALDVAPPQVVVSGLVMNVSRDFLETAGLSADAGATAWSLSARETHMLTGLIRAEKANGKVEVLSRPQIQVADKQTGFVQVGQEVVIGSATEVKVGGTTQIAFEKPVSRFVGMTLKVTPKLAPCGEAMTLSVDSQCSKAVPGLGIDLGNGKKATGFNECSVKVAAHLKKGESFVLLAQGDKETVTLVVLTPSAVVAPACPGWFTK